MNCSLADCATISLPPKPLSIKRKLCGGRASIVDSRMQLLPAAWRSAISAKFCVASPKNRSLRSHAELGRDSGPPRSEEHTSELQSHLNLVCRLLLEKKKK